MSEAQEAPPTAASTWEVMYRTGRAMRWFPSEAVLRFCARRLEDKTYRPVVLDVGCGNGANFWGLALHGYTVVGVEPSSTALLLAERLCAERCPKEQGVLMLGTAQDLQNNSAVRHYAPFDAIVDHMVSQHLPWSEHAAIYKSYLQLLKPGGWLCLVHLNNQTWPDATYGAGRMPNEYATWVNMREPAVYPNNGVVCMPAAAALCDALTVAGFNVARAENLSREYEVTAGGVGETYMAAHSAFDAQKPQEA